MSVQAMSWVFDHSPTTLGPRLVLLSIANHAKDDGTGAWPSVDAIAAEARMSPRHVQRCIRQLEAEGHLTVLTGKGPHRTNLYDVVLTGDDRLSPRRPVTLTSEPSEGDISVLEGDTQVTRTIKNRPEPSSKTTAAPNGADPFDAETWKHNLSQLHRAGWTERGSGALTWKFLMALRQRYGSRVVSSALSDARLNDSAPAMSAAAYFESICVRFAEIAVSA